jgi:DNA-binding transcriptional MerR regulator
MTNFTFYSSPTLALVCVADDAPALFSLDEAASLTGVHQEMLRYYCRLGLIGGLHRFAATGLFFDLDSLLEIRRIEHYRRHLGVGRQALPLICDLRRQGERLDIDLPFLSGP